MLLREAFHRQRKTVLATAYPDSPARLRRNQRRVDERVNELDSSEQTVYFRL